LQAKKLEKALGTSIFVSVTISLIVSVIVLYSSTSILFRLGGRDLKPVHYSFAASNIIFSLVFLAKLFRAFDQGQRLIDAQTEAKIALQDVSFKK
jgi:hypothetical protein